MSLFAKRTSSPCVSPYQVTTSGRLGLNSDCSPSTSYFALFEVVKYVSRSVPQRKSNGVRPPFGSSSTASRRAMVVLTMPSVVTLPLWGYLCFRVHFGGWNMSHTSFSEDQLLGRMIRHGDLGLRRCRQ